MNYKRIVIISKNEISSWKSCQSIVGNLASAYSKVFAACSLHFLQVPQEYNAYQAFKTAEQIKIFNPDLIIWIDHSPNPTNLIKALTDEYKNVSLEKKPRMLIHIFGDFVIDCLAWEKIKSELTLWPLHFITASFKQKRLVQKFFLSHENNVSCVPFPVDETVFNMTHFHSNRIEIRKTYSIADGEKIFLYTGRISYQKNVDLLLKAFASLHSALGEKCHLWIAGGVDDILLPYFGKHGIVGSYSSHLNQALRLSKPNIKFFGHCSTEELVKFYHASDMFVSMSTYNDEDYGMSPAEAICTGLPALLSNWGGYTSFAGYSSAVRLLPVSFDAFRPLVDSSQLKKMLMAEALKPNSGFEERNHWSEEALSKISIGAVADKFQRDLLALEFGPVENCSQVFLQMCTSFKNNKFAPFKDQSKENELSDLYKDVYSVYGD